MTELFPFGRRQLADEFLALLEAARATSPRPAILCSIRDILQPPSKPKRAAQTLERLGRYYDGVLVHADETVIPLDASWPVDKALARRLDYTGYVADRGRARALRLDLGEWRRHRRVGRRLLAGQSLARLLRGRRIGAAKGKMRAALAHPLTSAMGVEEDDQFQELVARGARECAASERAPADFPSLLQRRRRLGEPSRPATTPSSTFWRPARAPCWCPSRRAARRSSACAPSASSRRKGAPRW